jgi:hypothetical protein
MSRFSLPRKGAKQPLVEDTRPPESPEKKEFRQNMQKVAFGLGASAVEAEWGEALLPHARYAIEYWKREQESTLQAVMPLHEGSNLPDARYQQNIRHLANTLHQALNHYRSQ